MVPSVLLLVGPVGLGSPTTGSLPSVIVRLVKRDGPREAGQHPTDGRVV